MWIHYVKDDTIAIEVDGLLYMVQGRFTIVMFPVYERNREDLLRSLLQFMGLGG